MVCGNSDPGTSGVLSPFGKINGLYFNDSKEPDDYMWSFQNDMKKILDTDGVEYIKVDTETKEDYYKLLDKLHEFNENVFKVSGTSRDTSTIILENPDDPDESHDENKDEE